MQNWIKAKGYEIMGPLIMYSSGITGMDGDIPIFENKIMFQLKNSNIKLEIPYQCQKELRKENCLMSRFNGKLENLQYATQKLTLHAYENDIELTGETYMVILKQSVFLILRKHWKLPVIEKYITLE